MSVIRKFNKKWKTALYNSYSECYSTDDTEVLVYDYSTFRPGWKTSDFDKSDFIFETDNMIFCYRDPDFDETSDSSILATWTLLINPQFSKGCSTCSGKNTSYYYAYIVDKFHDFGRYAFCPGEYDLYFKDTGIHGSLFNIRYACMSMLDNPYSRHNRIYVHKFGLSSIYTKFSMMANIGSSGSFINDETGKVSIILYDKNYYIDNNNISMKGISSDILVNEVCLKWLNIADIIELRTVNKYFADVISDYIKKYMSAEYIFLIEETFDRVVEYRSCDDGKFFLIDTSFVIYSTYGGIGIFYDGVLLACAENTSMSIDHVHAIVSVVDEEDTNKYIVDMRLLEWSTYKYCIYEEDIFLINNHSNEIYYLGASPAKSLEWWE